MTQFAGGLKTIIDNGRERRTDGLFKHLGLLDAGSLRATNNLIVQTGAGLELLYDRPSLASYVLSYDRDLSVYRDLNIAAKTINFQPQSGGKVILPVGTTQARIASYQSAPTWNTSATGWQETIIQANGTSTGADTRFEANIVWSHSAAGAGIYFAFYIDGVSYGGALSTVSVQAANYAITTSMLLYASPGAGPHRFAVGINNTVGTFSIFTGGASVLYVTEQKA